MQQKTLNSFTLCLLISFASVNAVLYTPALPAIAHFFAISNNTAQLTMTWFLIGYTLGQLIYGPLANRFGRKPALYIGISLQVISSLICLIAGTFHDFTFLIIGRFFLALGSGVGLKMTFTLINESYEPKIATQKIAYTMLAFGITPGLGIALGGLLTAHFGWTSCFYASAVYGLILLGLCTCLPETQQQLDLNAIKWQHLIKGYRQQFNNFKLINAGFIMGACTCFIYIFAAIGPFIAINLLGMNSAQYGIANILPPLGIIIGSLLAGRLAKKYHSEQIIRFGIMIVSITSVLMLITLKLHLPIIVTLFLPLILINFGLALILPNASAIAMKSTNDKAHGSAVMSFINMGVTTCVVLNMGFFTIKVLLLPSIYLTACIALIGLYYLITKGGALNQN